MSGLVSFLMKESSIWTPEVSFWFICKFNLSTMISVVCSKYPKDTSIGRRAMTVSQLNISWTVAAANAKPNSFRFEACIKETMVFVIEVPMLAPITIGIAFRTEITLFMRKKQKWKFKKEEEEKRRETLTAGRNHGDHNGSWCWRTLHQNGDQNSDHQTDNWISK